MNKLDLTRIAAPLPNEMELYFDTGDDVVKIERAEVKDGKLILRGIDIESFQPSVTYNDGDKVVFNGIKGFNDGVHEIKKK